MSLFSEMLARFVDSKSIKIYQLANLCGIERSWLQKMLTGKRKPADQEQVMNLSQALALTYTETQQLMNAYRILEMGEENWLRRNSVLKLLKSFRHRRKSPADRNSGAGIFAFSQLQQSDFSFCCGCQSRPPLCSAAGILGPQRICPHHGTASIFLFV